MKLLIQVLNSRYFLWALLALPAIPMTLGLLGDANPHRLLHPTGEFAARFMIIAMIISPLRLMFPKAKWPMWLMKRRRYFGVAAFFYALLHTIAYLMDVKTLEKVITQLPELGIWTGWLAFLIFIPLAVTSNDASQRAMLAAWKTLQRLVYPAAVLTLVHWIFVENHIGGALVHFLPLAALEIFRVWKLRDNQRTKLAN